MKKIQKKILSLFMVLVLFGLMSIPVMASGFRPNGAFGYLLNINGNVGDPLTGRTCNLYQTPTVGTDQNFNIGTKAGYTGYYMMTVQNTNYAVNRRTSDARAIIWPLSTGAPDSRLYNNDTSVIRLNSTRELLTAREPIGNLSTVYFGGSGNSVWIKIG